MNVKDLPDCTKCMLQRVPANCVDLFHTLNACNTVKIARGVKRPTKRLCPSSRFYNIRRKAYFLSLSHPENTALDNWLIAENIINLNYPD
jgi:hypothetical protein